MYNTRRYGDVTRCEWRRRLRAAPPPPSCMQGVFFFSRFFVIFIFSFFSVSRDVFLVVSNHVHPHSDEHTGGDEVQKGE